MLASLAAVLLAAGAARAQGVVRGHVRIELPGTALADLGPVVVYLERDAMAPAPPKTVPVIRQKDARFAPAFLAVAAGQRIEMPNDDLIFHNVFSYSEPNAFDLGLYPSGESREVTFRHAGEVKLYCSIHESMNGTIFVAPTPWFTVADADGGFVLRGAPPGPARLRTWTQRLPDTERTIEVPASGELAIEVPLLP